MHEVGIAENLLEMALQAAKAQNASKIHAMRVLVGDMSGIVAESLEFAFSCVSEATIAEGCHLTLESESVTCFCHHCQTSFEPTDLVYFCPQCFNLSNDIRAGKDLVLTSLEVS